MTFTLQTVRVANVLNEEGMLVFDKEQQLLAVLTQLGDQYGDLSGYWYLEAGFGRAETRDPPRVGDLDAAQRWIRQRLAGEH
ncbi:hypothetical protein [Microvirga zambiensis]|uniref:hypothetical protein n=1 Tax=Microvirga zambiensis TaxID=1402137 RepID=UPI00191CC0D6|nr:hypothetical protein [Microvirga zambiensis]